MKLVNANGPNQELNWGPQQLPGFVHYKFILNGLKLSSET